MLTQAVPLAAAGAIYPIAFAAIVAILGGAEPMRRAVAFLAGGTFISLIAFILIVVLLAELDFTPRHHPAISATIKIVLGAGLLGLAAYTLVRHGIPRAAVPGPAPEPTSQPTSQPAAELAAEPVAGRAAAGSLPVDPAPGPPASSAAGPAEGPAEAATRDAGSVRRAFISGMIVYFPGIFLIASAKAVADARASIAPTVLVSVVCVVVLLLVVEIPILAFALARERVQPPLERITRTAKMHSKQVILAIELVGGAYLLIAGILAL